MGTTGRGRVFACCKRYCLSEFTLKSLFIDLGENISPRCSLFGEFPLIPFSRCSKILAICLLGSSNTFLERAAVKVGMVRIVRMPAGTGRHESRGGEDIPASPACPQLRLPAGHVPPRGLQPCCALQYPWPLKCWKKAVMGEISIFCIYGHIYMCIYIYIYAHPVWGRGWGLLWTLCQQACSGRGCCAQWLRL